MTETVALPSNRTLYHHPLVPLARKVRMALREKRLTFIETPIEPWLRDPAHLALDPAGDLPVLVEEDGSVIAATAVCDYIDEAYPDPPLLGRTPAERAEARRMAAWFDRKFDQEVTQHLAHEKLIRRVAVGGAPDSRALRAGRENIHTHLHYIAWLVDRRSWLAGDNLTMADLSAAAHLSLLDYTADVPWEEHPVAKEWYARLKSRPSVRSLLQDVVIGVPPAAVYANLDF